jgi:hypothetical protein
MRLALLLACMPIAVSGQEPKRALEVPADRRVDTYAIYSTVLTHPSLSHVDNNDKYLVVEFSGVPMEEAPQSCMAVPEKHRASFAELLADRSEHYQERFRLKRALKIRKPYDLISDDQANQFRDLRDRPDSRADGVELFRGAVDLITLGNVYFDRRRTVAAVYTSWYCGNLCANLTWRVFIRDRKGSWDEQRWTTCDTIAASRLTSLAAAK